MEALGTRDFSRLERNQPGFVQHGDWLHADSREWGRFISRKVFRTPVSFRITAEISKIHDHWDARPYDGLSILWGRPDAPNDENLNINLLRRRQEPVRWQQEHNSRYRGRSGLSDAPKWQTGDIRVWDFIIHEDTVFARTNGVTWEGWQDPELSEGRLVVRADRCHIRLKVEYMEGVLRYQRINGNDRFATAAEVSRTRFPDPSKAKKVYVVTGHNFPDSLSVGAMATDGPVLLTNPTSVPVETAREIERLAPVEVVVVGGVNAISNDCANKLGACGSGN